MLAKFLERCLLVALSVMPVMSDALAQDKISGNELKTAYLFNFLKFVEWPQEVSDPQFTTLHVCAYSGDPLLPYLKTLERKKVRNLDIAIQVYDSVNETASCQMIYLEGLSADKRKEIIEMVRGKPVLTVGNEGAYDNNDEIIDFFIEEGRLRFDINFSQVRDSGVQMSSRLLKLARISGR